MLPKPPEDAPNVQCADANPEDTTSQTHLSVVYGAQADDADAWEALVRAYSRRVYRWCRQDGLQAADAANVVQDVLRAVATSIGDFRRDRAGDSFRAWLRRITQNKIRDHFRRETRQIAHAAGGTDAYEQLANYADDEASPAQADDARQAAEGAPRLDPAICSQVRNEYSPRDWRLFWRVVVDGQSAAEAGAEFGASANAVRLVKMRILRRFRQLVANE
jgi:RNA polymerase sigma-70 factor (ECF subfamily)